MQLAMTSGLTLNPNSPIMSIRRWDTGEIIANQRLMDMAGYIGHRGDYRTL